MSTATTPVRGRTMSLPRLISICISARLLIDLTTQMFNPFLPIFAAGLRTDVVVMGRLVSVRSIMGLLAPLFGSLADRFGYRLVLRGALLTGAAGLAVVGSSRSIAQALVGMVLLGLSTAGFVPTLQAYLSARLPYAQRARGIGILEYSWALTGIVGLSLTGWLIAATSWRTPFFVVSGGLALMAVVFGVLPSAAEERADARPPPDPLARRHHRLLGCRRKPCLHLCDDDRSRRQLLRRHAIYDHPRRMVRRCLWPRSARAGSGRAPVRLLRPNRQRLRQPLHRPHRQTSQRHPGHDGHAHRLLGHPVAQCRPRARRPRLGVDALAVSSSPSSAFCRFSANKSPAGAPK